MRVVSTPRKQRRNSETQEPDKTNQQHLTRSNTVAIVPWTAKHAAQPQQVTNCFIQVGWVCHLKSITLIDSFHGATISTYLVDGRR